MPMRARREPSAERVHTEKELRFLSLGDDEKCDFMMAVVRHIATKEASRSWRRMRNDYSKELPGADVRDGLDA